MEKLRLFFENYGDVIINLSASIVILFGIIMMILLIIFIIKELIL